MQNKPWFYPLWALTAFWAWAFHVATGFLNNLISAHSGKRSAIIGMLDSFTNALLVGPLGRPLTVGLLIIAEATSADGAERFTYGSMTFDACRASSVFEAIFTSDDTDNKYADEAGFAPWQGANTLNAKGFGTITDLAVAAANDNQGSVWPERPFHFERVGPMKSDGALARRVG
jgi:hypothetical protein